MNVRKWILYVFGMLVAARVFLLLLNLAVDPYGVFGTGLLEYERFPNERQIKAEHINSHPLEYDSFIFGSSRAGVIDTRQLERYLPGSRFYNVSLAESNWYDIFRMLNIIRTGPGEIKNAVILLEYDFWGTAPPDSKDMMILKKTPPLYKNNGQVGFYLDYLKRIPLVPIYCKIRNNISEPDDVFDFNGTGMSFYRASEKKIAFDQNAFILKSNTLQANRAMRNVRWNSKDTLPKVRFITDYLRNKNVNVIYIVPPLNYNRVNYFRLYDYIDFLYTMSTLVEYWDFGAYNSVTTDNRNYYDDSHFRPLVSDMMLGRIFNDTSVDVPDDFGVRVNSQNIGRHIEDIEHQFQWADSKWAVRSIH